MEETDFCFAYILGIFLPMEKSRTFKFLRLHGVRCEHVGNIFLKLIFLYLALQLQRNRKIYDVLNLQLPYSIRFDVFLRTLNPRWTNIIHHGSSDAIRRPAIWFFPGSSRLHVRIDRQGKNGLNLTISDFKKCELHTLSTELTLFWKANFLTESRMRYANEFGIE